MAQLRISAWAIRNPIPVAVVSIALVLTGLISFALLPIKQWPNLVFPAVSVTVTQSGAAPGEMETQITRPVEDAVASLSNVREIFSSVTQGVSSTTVQFEFGTDLQKATDQVRTKVEQTRVQMPREIDPPSVQRVEIDSAPILTYAVASSSMSTVDLSWFVDDTLTRALQHDKGVAQVARVGGASREINVVVDPDRLAALGVTAPQVNQALFGFADNIPGGRVDVGGREQTLRVLGSAETVAQLRELTIPTGGGKFVKLADLAEIGDGSGEERAFARLDGKPVVAFQVMKTREASDIQVEDRVKATLAKLGADHKEVTFTKVISTVDDTRNSFAATLHTLLEGMALASLVVWLFLRDWRSTVITALAMPMALIPTFGVMAVLGFSVNVVTLLGLTLVVGILIDDAIVEIENIEKRVQAGVAPYKASIEGADSIGLAVVATTAAIVVVFLPVSFMPGIPGQYFKEFGLTVSVAVLFSLLVARFVTPLLAAYFLKPARHPHPRGDLRPFYRKSLEWALSHRIVSVLIGGLMFMASVAGVFLLPTGFQPPSNNNYYYVRIQGPPGATIADMDRVVQDATRLFKKQPETKAVFAQVGSGSDVGFGASDQTDGTIIVVLNEHRQAKVTQIRARLREALHDIPDARVNFRGDGFGTADVQTVLTSESGPKLEKAADELERQMRSLSSVADPRPQSTPVAPEIIIRPKPDEAARLGVSSDVLAQIARVATVGDIDANTPKFNDGERRVPIRVRLPADARSSLEAIKALQVPTAGGGTTPLASVADVEFRAGPAKINRYARQRQLTIEADLQGGAQLGQALKQIDGLPIMQKLPPGVNKPAQGDAEAMIELFGGLVMAILSGLFMIYGVLVLLFRSFFKPITILSALPLTGVGTVAALLVMHEAISLPSMIGILMLLGLAAKNSILLVEYAIERERAGVDRFEALIEACRERARPIIMTTMAMAAGMLPTALGLGAGSEFRQPMAVAVIGGLMSSTVLSLVLVPVVYEIVDDIELWLAPKFGRFLTPREA